MKKLNKRNYTLVKSYKLIDLFNYFSKVIKMLVTEQFSEFFEINENSIKNR